MADHDDPIIISDDEEQPQPRPRRACRREIPMSVWYGQRRNRRGGVARQRGFSTRERAMLAYICALTALVYPDFGVGVNRLTGARYTLHDDNARYLREERFEFIRIPTITTIAQAMAANQRVQMS